MTESKAISKVAANPIVEVDGFKLKKLSIISTFSDIKKIDKEIAKFSVDALSVIPDLSTVKSRGEIASIAYKISKKKTNIVGQMIDPSIEEAKTLVKNVNAGKKHFQTKMDELRDEVRKPLNEWEAEEKIREDKRIFDIKENIEGISSIATFDPSNPPNKDEITSLIEAVDGIDCTEGFDEFTQDALQAKSQAKEVLAEMLNKIIQKEISDKAALELEQKEAELEIQRLKQQAQERLNKLMMIPVSLIGKASTEISAKIVSLTNYEVPEEQFGELYETAKTSVANVIQQLTMMQQQQALVEATQAKAYLEEEAKVNEDLAPDHVEAHKTQARIITEKIDKAIEEPVEQTTKTHGGYISKRTLTPHEEQLAKVQFWANQYGVHGGMYNDLLNILNQYK